MSTTVKFLHTLLIIYLYWIHNFIIAGVNSASSVGIALYLCLYLVITDLMVFWILFLLSHVLIERELVKNKTTKAYIATTVTSISL